ncbi:MAG: penicillin-binding protein activator LpoB [Propionivibrio sp.]|uniref:Penicillin-binding protein activator LpoB n=1 Tax=Candidatus Propionivibrio dominans TaxID=2954373 RepID=A0A9D7I734_9RHOO|nr:penicillin-binding protein activator LpoB [Candidatus Propionivibrio dominans]MBL0165932.1 penicillin-binding protein activator LpoB [Propionivibrio sp.]
MNAKWFIRAGLALFATVSFAAPSSPPRLAVAELAYGQHVSGTIDRADLRKLAADIRSGLQKSGSFQLVQGKSSAEARKNERLSDVIGRIKSGMYPGADYVLFGEISSYEFRQEANPIKSTDTVSHTLSLDLVGEFTVVSTKNYAVKTRFSATGEGQDVKLVTSQGGRVVLNRNKVISEASRSLGEEVTKQLEEQLGGFSGGADDSANRPLVETPREEVIIFK